MMALSPDLLFAMLFNPGRIGVIAALPEELQSLLDAMPDAEPVERAGRISAAWQEMRIAIGEADTYNLDRKQHALTMILRLHDTLRM